MRPTDLSLRTKLIALAIISILALAIPSIVMLSGLYEVAGFFPRTAKAHDIVRAVASIQRNSSKMQAGLQAYVLGAGEKNLEQYRAGYEESLAELGRLKPLVADNPSQQKQVRDSEELLSKWRTAVADPAIAGMRPSESASVTETSSAKIPNFEPVSEMITKVLAIAEDQMAGSDAYSLTSQQNFGRIKVLLYLGAPAYAIIILLIVFILARTIAKPVSDAANAAEAISRGELSHRVDIHGTGETRRLGSALNSMAEDLTAYNKRISEGVELLTNLAAQIGGTSSELYAGATQTSSSISETATTVGEMEKTARFVNETSREIAEQSERTDQVANAGAQATSETLQKMTLIKDKMDIVSTAVVKLSDNTKYIEEIISAVQDFAHESNLLAVNASIEAARAGDQGKGFAVVAQEIKSLADQSKDATEKITQILQEIGKSVASVVMATEQGGKAVLEGVEQSRTAGKSIEDLSDSVSRFTKAAGAIFSETGKQFTRVERVASTVRDIESAMKNSVEATRHLEETGRELEQLSSSLEKMLNGRGKDHTANS
ncbi:MAG: methyl-accepting chemotaxis protein [Bacteroidetes bacterium]|nr:methyl-accepting chemotaxis protein [Bacteroidota bacterium]